MTAKDLMQRIAQLAKAGEQALANFHMINGQKAEAENMMKSLINAEAQAVAKATAPATEPVAETSTENTNGQTVN